ncbi:MAG: flagellar protein FlaG [Thermoleophilaceae bacterium]
MSFEVPPVGRSEQPLRTAAPSRNEPSKSTAPVDAVQVDAIPASPPPEVLAQVDAAARRVDELAKQNRELRFSYDETAGRVQIQVCDKSGTVIRTIPPSKALSIADGDDI